MKKILNFYPSFHRTTIFLAAIYLGWGMCPEVSFTPNLTALNSLFNEFWQGFRNLIGE